MLGKSFPKTSNLSKISNEIKLLLYAKLLWECYVPIDGLFQILH